MALFSERNALSILEFATDPEGDPLTVTEVNGNPALIGAAVPLSVGGHVTVTSAGAVVFDDTGFTWPAGGGSVFDSIIATVSDGTNTVPVAVNLQFNNP